MSFRCIMIESSAHLSVRNEQLLIRTDAEHSVPIEDITALMLENRQSVISVAALSQLGQNGCAVFICDEKHIPCAVLEPYQQHSRALEVLRRQIDATEPMKKRLWQSVVKAKMLVFFDLPVKTAANHRAATRFRQFLLNDGYHMIQYSVYVRVCNGMDAVEKHRMRLRANLPDNGAVRMLLITEKQYEAIEIWLESL